MAARLALAGLFSALAALGGRGRGSDCEVERFFTGGAASGLPCACSDRGPWPLPPAWAGSLPGSARALLLPRAAKRRLLGGARAAFLPGLGAPPAAPHLLGATAACRPGRSSSSPLGVPEPLPQLPPPTSLVHGFWVQPAADLEATDGGAQWPWTPPPRDSTLLAGLHCQFSLIVWVTAELGLCDGVCFLDLAFSWLCVCDSPLRHRCSVLHSFGTVKV